ncbi:MAG: glycoside hydrolase, partial [Fibrobacter sp.]|nr:glycoside hydrolase [Fibrobacter sp.]
MVKGLLTVNMSEPVNMNDAGKYIQRERGEYIPPEKPQGSGKSYLFSYNEKDNVIHAGDRIRLVPDVLGAAYIDKNNNVPTVQNPYVRITGDENTRFTVTLTKPVASPKAEAYTGLPESLKDKAFVTSAIVNGKNYFIDESGNLLGQADTSIYASSGPNFEVEITMPSASFVTHEGMPMYDYHLKVVMDLYDNLGQYVNTYKLDIPTENFTSMRGLVDNGIFKFNLEWAAKDNEAPVAKKGNKIGTGAYIAKFDFEAETFCATKFDEFNNDYKLKCEKKGIKADKATGSKTKTFGFKRKI